MLLRLLLLFPRHYLHLHWTRGVSQSWISLHRVTYDDARKVDALTSHFYEKETKWGRERQKNIIQARTKKKNRITSRMKVNCRAHGVFERMRKKETWVTYIHHLNLWSRIKGRTRGSKWKWKWKWGRPLCIQVDKHSRANIKRCAFNCKQIHHKQVMLNIELSNTKVYWVC